MKASSIFLAAGFVLLPWCLSPLFSQQSTSNSDKTITIITRSVDRDGSEVTETIVKKGKAAENFDVDKYVRENRKDNRQVEVIVNDEQGDNEDNGEESWNFMMNGMFGCNDNSTFLGVEEDSDEDADEPGLVVEVIRGSAADAAGLHHNDKILSLDNTKTDKWSDLSKFISQKKAGDKVKITYSRNGKTATTEATLITRKDVKCSAEQQSKGQLGIYENDDDEDAAGVAVSVKRGGSAEKAGLKDGDIIYQLNDTPIADFEDITDFMAYTKAGEKVLMAYEHEGQRKNAEVILSEYKGNVTYNNDSPRLMNISGLGNDNKDVAAQLSNLTCTFKTKEACLGVFSGDEEHGTAVVGFTDESAAREAGILEKDLILSVNNQAVNGHSELWNEIAKYNTGDAVNVSYDRDGKTFQVKATLKACRDQSRVEVFDASGNDDRPKRRFYTGSWGDDDQRRLRETRIIIIRRSAGEGDGAKINLPPADAKPAQDRSLSLQAFRAFPNPSQGQVMVEFKGEPVETVVSLLDMSGRQLFREELNAFNGDYSQQFDLTAYAKGTIIIHVQQGEKIYTEQLILN